MTRKKQLPSADRLLRLVDAMTGRPVAMLVDLVVDRFITGTPKRISREAPVLILGWASETSTPGGGANAVANVRALGGRPFPLGIVGDDKSGRVLVQTLDELGVSTAGILTRSGYRTPTKTRILGGGKSSIKQQIVRYDVEDRVDLDAEEIDRLLAALERWRGGEPDLGVGVFSDYGYGVVRPDLAGKFRELLAPGARLLCDSRYRLEEFRGFDGATPNEEEAEALLARGLDDPPGAGEAGRRLLADLGGAFLLITRGRMGMSLFEARSAAHLPVHGTDQVADVTGAGDTVIGTLALALAAGASPFEAALLANYAGGVVVMKMGTATLSPKELRAAVASNPSLVEAVRWEG